MEQAGAAPAGGDAGMSSPVITEWRGPHATIFEIRNHWEWGTIVVRPYRGMAGAEVLCNSSFGCYAYGWSHMGCDWRSFLADLAFDYAMGKMAGQRFRVPLESEEFVSLMRAELDQLEAAYKADWGEVPEAKAADILTCREALGDSWLLDDYPREAYFKAFDEAAMGRPYLLELYDCRLDKPCPQARGFWDKIWTPFMNRLHAENVALERRWARELDLAGVSDIAEAA